MADFVFPNTNDNLDETNLRTWVQRISGSQNYVNNGFVVSAGTGLNVNITAGEACGAGCWMQRTTTSNNALSPALTANATNYVYVSFDDALQNTVIFQSNTTGVAPSTRAVLLATVTTNASVVTGVTDRRNTTAISRWRAP